MAETRIFPGRSGLGPRHSRPCFHLVRCGGVAAWVLAGLLTVAPSAVAQTPAMPPTTGSDMELDPDRAREEPAQPAQPEPPPPLSAAPEGTWGVGGKDEEGKFAPQGKTGALKDDEDEADEKKPVELGPPGELWLDTVIGFGKIRDVVHDSAPTELTSFSFIPGLSYRIGEAWTVSLRMPFSRASIIGPENGTADDYNASVTGNLELTVRPSFRLTRRLRLPVSISLYAPTAAGDPFTPRQDNVGRAESLINQAAAASRGWEENALFASKRFGVAPAVGLTYDRDALHATVGTRLEIMVRAGGEEPYKIDAAQPQPELRDPITSWVTGGSVVYDFLGGKVSPGLRTWLAVNTTPVAVGTRDYSGAQLVIEPEVQGRLPLNAAGSFAVRATLGYLLPVGGRLGGADDASVSGLRIKASLLF